MQLINDAINIKNFFKYEFKFFHLMKKEKRKQQSQSHISCLYLVWKYLHVFYQIMNLMFLTAQPFFELVSGLQKD